MVNMIISEDNKILPSQWDIGKKYYTDIKKDALNHELRQFLNKALEKLDEIFLEDCNEQN
jgi:hypothetical protein